jgi:hypothetical protein
MTVAAGMPGATHGRHAGRVAFVARVDPHAPQLPDGNE